MINRPRTAFVSVAAVAVSMIMLGSDARAKSGPAASPKNYMGFLLRLPDARTGMSLMQTYMSLEWTRNILKNIPHPGPRIIQQIACLYNQETRVFTNLQKNIHALLATEVVLEGRYLALETQKEALLSKGKVLLAQRVAILQGQVFNVLNGVQGLVVVERGLATPVR